MRPKKEMYIERICLKCDKSFNSLGAGNRICRGCSSENLNGPGIRVIEMKAIDCPPKPQK